MARPLSDFLPRELMRQMAHTTRRYSGPSALALSPDARTLAYVTDRSGTYSAWTVPVGGAHPKPEATGTRSSSNAPAGFGMGGSEPVVAVAVEGGAVHSLCWSAGGDLIATVDRGGTERYQLYVTRPSSGVPRRSEAPVGSKPRIEPLATSPGHRVQHLMSWNAAAPDGRTLAISSNSREPADMDIVLVDVRSGTQRPLVTGPAWHVAGGWSPDGRSLLVMRVADNTEQTVCAVDVASGEQRELTPHPGHEGQHVPAGWLADGRAIVMTDEVGGPRHIDLVAIDPRSLERKRLDVFKWDVELAVSSADGRVQAWSVNEDGYSRLRWRVDGGARGEREIGGVCADLVVSADGSRVAYVRQTAREPSQLWVIDTATGEARPVVVTTTSVDPDDLVEPELVRVPAPKGPVPAFIFRPKGARGRVPAILYPHGGPEAQSRPGYSHTLAMLQCLIHRGIALVVPNIHGSTGYGRAWQEAIHRDWGGVDLDDLRAVSDWMAAEPDFDPERLGVFGGSYGGFAALTCATRIPERWRCAVDLYGVSNLVTMIENAEPNWRRFLARWIGDVERDRATLLERSPITHIENVRCPMLIIQGANDPRVPKEESDQVVERLRALGRRVEYVVYDDEGHGFTKRRNAEIAWDRIVEYLSKELLA